MADGDEKKWLGIKLKTFLKTGRPTEQEKLAALHNEAIGGLGIPPELLGDGSLNVTAQQVKVAVGDRVSPYTIDQRRFAASINDRFAKLDATQTVEAVKAFEAAMNHAQAMAHQAMYKFGDKEMIPDTIITHPNNVDLIMRGAMASGGLWQLTLDKPPMSPLIYGMQVVGNPLLPEFETRWEFPQDKFWSYGPEDEWWCRWLGKGREIKTRYVIACRTGLIRDILRGTGWMAAQRPMPEPQYPPDFTRRPRGTVADVQS